MLGKAKEVLGKAKEVLDGAEEVLDGAQKLLGTMLMQKQPILVFLMRTKVDEFQILVPIVTLW